jgi:hypothetical protein
MTFLNAQFNICFYYYYYYYQLLHNKCIYSYISRLTIVAIEAIDGYDV